MNKVERRFNAWVDAHEKELTALMNNPEKWKFYEDFILPQNGQISPFDLAILMKMAFQDTSEVQEQEEKNPEPNLTNSEGARVK